ncbi:hypothetical protein R3P38DRAFT_3216637 [Favolaschia claudopus]|uniref:DUF6533 domain-containing protein n=1 Tax=Favolaschia claudopus TaxID=2862362 RepID=A0AAW0A6M4_9AGAR
MPQADYFTVLTQAQWERNCQFAAAMIVAYEYILQLPNEVDLFWRKRWTIAKGLFLWSRYYSLAYNIGNAAVFMQAHASEELYVLCDKVIDLTQPPAVSLKFFVWQNGGSIIQPTTTQLILSLRLYAMYARSKKILALLMFVILCQIAGLIVLLYVPQPGLVAENNPAFGLYICADADPEHVHWIAYAPMISILGESVFLALAMFKALEQRQAPGRILPRLTKESLFFFTAILGIHVGNLTCWMVNNLSTNELFTGFAFSIPAVLANRLLISVREQVEEDTIVDSHPSHLLQFNQPRRLASETISGDSIELRSRKIIGDC